MIKIEDVVVSGTQMAIRGMRNPMDSWDKSDSFFTKEELEKALNPTTSYFAHDKLYPFYVTSNGFVGFDDAKLMQKLYKAGSDHSKYMRMITIQCDITAPLYWWKEYDTYKVGTVANSCSTMHKIHSKPFSVFDFSTDKMIGDTPEAFIYVGDTNLNGLNVLEDCIIPMLEVCRVAYNKTKNKDYWWKMIQLLPTSYNQKRTVQFSLSVLDNMIRNRSNHKLDEWVEFADFFKEIDIYKIVTNTI